MFRDDHSVPFLELNSQRRMGRLALKNGTDNRYSETSVNKYQTELHKNSEGRISQQNFSANRISFILKEGFKLLGIPLYFSTRGGGGNSYFVMPTSTPV
jgi:hypothetical protein